MAHFRVGICPVCGKNTKWEEKIPPSWIVKKNHISKKKTLRKLKPRNTKL